MSRSEEIRVLTEVIPPNCLGVKCVWGTRVYSALAYALHRLAMILDPERVGVPPSLRQRFRRDLLRAFRSATETYPSIEVGITEELAGLYPRHVIEAVVTEAKSVASSLHDFIRRNRVRSTPLNPLVGWSRIVRSEQIIVNREYFIFTARLITDVYGLGRGELVVCGDYECYPLPFGIYPTNSLRGLAEEAGDLDSVRRLEEKYGYVTIYRAIEEAGVREAALVIQPKSSVSKPVFFLLVDEPRKTAHEIALLQVEAREVELEMVARLAEVDREVLSEERDLRTVIERVLREVV